MLEAQCFIYRDAHGALSVREVEDASIVGDYLQGHDLARNGELRTFRVDRILERLEDHNQADARLQHWTAILPPPEPSGPHQSRPRKQNQAGAQEVCFTGFKAAEKTSLITEAEGLGFFVRTGVAEHLAFLVAGATAGPAKLKAARVQGVLVLTQDQWRSLLETGEVPGD